MPVHLAGENRAGGIGIAADGDDGMDRLVQKFLQVLRAMAGNVNARLGHDLDGQRMDETGRLGAGALDIHQVARRPAQKTFRDMAAAGIAGAENENGGLHNFGKRRTFNIQRSTSK